MMVNPAHIARKWISRVAARPCGSRVLLVTSAVLAVVVLCCRFGWLVQPAISSSSQTVRSLYESPEVITKSSKLIPEVLYKRLHDTDLQTSKEPSKLKSEAKLQIFDKKILLWTPFWGSYKFYDHEFIRLLEKDCPVSTCHITANRSELGSADVVVFHLTDFTKSTELPRYRPLDQLWLAFVIEAPPVASRGSDVKRLRGLVNWTMSYRPDSDVVAPYGVVVKREAPELWRRDHDYWKQKTRTKMAAWMVSNCVTHSRRENFVSELQKHMAVDVFGKCGPKKCGLSLTQVIKNKTKKEDCEDVINDYFFYLAFENALCLGYVTEKFFLALTRSVIPVVFGKADYATIAPPHSYINALDYASPRELADALLSIASNRTAYNSYFTWKADYTVDLGDPFRPHMCDLCAKLHGAPLQFSEMRHPGPQNKSSSATPDLLHWRDASSCQQWRMPKT